MAISHSFYRAVMGYVLLMPSREYPCYYDTTRNTLFINSCQIHDIRERSGSVVECLTRDQRAVGSSLTGITALCS